MSKGLEALEKVEDFYVDYGGYDETGEYKNYISLYQTPEYQVIRKELKALGDIKFILKDLIEFNEIDLPHIDKVIYEIKIVDKTIYASKEKYELLKEVLL